MQDPELKYEPAPHATQAVLASLLTWELVPQSAQDVCPAVEVKVFPEHSAQLFPLSNFPASHGTHCVAPEVTGSPAAFLASVPSLHCVQLAAPAPLIEFASQASQEKLFVVLAFFPASQTWHPASPPVNFQNSPPPQVLQSSELSCSPADSPTVKLPSAQPAQVADPAASLYSFVGHTAQSSAASEPWALCVPSPQASQAVFPSFEYFPPAQTVQESEPVWSAKKPPAHGVHVPSPPAVDWYRPAAHHY